MNTPDTLPEELAKNQKEMFNSDLKAQMAAAAKVCSPESKPFDDPEKLPPSAQKRVAACNKFVEEKRKKGWPDRRIVRAAKEKFNVNLIKE